MPGNDLSAGGWTAEDGYAAPPGKKRYCGLALLWWILLGVVAILAIVLGSTLGVLLPRRNSESTTASAPTTSPSPSSSSSATSTTSTAPTSTPTPPTVLASSKLSASAWQDQYNSTIYTVAFQNPAGELMVSQWNSSTSKWNVTNVNTALAVGGRSISPRNGTALTSDYAYAYDSYHQTFYNLRFVNTGDEPDYAVGGQGYDWFLGTMANYNPPKVPAGAQMAAYFDNCAAGCSNASYLVYEDAAQNLSLWQNYHGDRNWAWQDFGPPDVLPMPNASLALARYRPAGTKTLDPTGVRVYVDVSKNLQEYIRSSSTDSWRLGGYKFPLTDANSTAAYESPWIAATSWRPSSQYGLENVLITLLFGNGSLVLHWWDQVTGTWNHGYPSLGNISAVAIHADMRAYCLRNGVIQEYSIDETKPDSWTLMGNVSTVEGAS